MVDVVNARLRRHLAANVPGWSETGETDMTSSDKVVGLHEQVSAALFDNGGDLSTLKARAEFHRTQDEEQCVYNYKNLEMYTEDWMLDFILGQILLQLEAFDVDSLADKWFTAPVNEFIHPGTVSPPPLEYASDPPMSDLYMDDGSSDEGGGGVTPQEIAHKKAAPKSVDNPLHISVPSA